MNGDYDLAAVGMAPLLMAAFLANQLEAVALENLGRFVPGSAGSRKGDFEYFSAAIEIKIRRFEPKLKGLLRILDGVFFTVAGRGTAWKFREDRGPPFRLGIVLNYQASRMRGQGC